jgi:hypothetical protein
MNNKHISQLELQKLASNTIQSISLHSLGQWVKSQTNDEFLVIPKIFIIDAIEYIQKDRYSDEFLGHGIKKKCNIEAMKAWL